MLKKSHGWYYYYTRIARHGREFLASRLVGEMDLVGALGETPGEVEWDPGNDRQAFRRERVHLESGGEDNDYDDDQLIPLEDDVLDDLGDDEDETTSAAPPSCLTVDVEFAAELAELANITHPPGDGEAVLQKIVQMPE